MHVVLKTELERIAMASETKQSSSHTQQQQTCMLNVPAFCSVLDILASDHLQMLELDARAYKKEQDARMHMSSSSTSTTTTSSNNGRTIR